MKISAADIENFDKKYRAFFVNSLSGYKSANLIGTADAQGRSNLAVFSSVVHLGADPALVGMVVRPASVPRHTYENIVETGVYTINHIHSAIVEASHQTAARYADDVSEFDATGLTAEYIDGCHAPFVAESRVKFSVSLVSSQQLDINRTLFVIGKIETVIVEDGAVQADGYINIEQLDSVAVSGLDSYHTGDRVKRLSYAKPDRAPRQVTVHPE